MCHRHVQENIYTKKNKSTPEYSADVNERMNKCWLGIVMKCVHSQTTYCNSDSLGSDSIITTLTRHTAKQLELAVV